MNHNVETAIITNIQRFSIHDGPGIRTTVFFKGCNLRCLWCHNPETQSMGRQLMFYEHKCVKCGACQNLCTKMFTEECRQCGKCAEVCTHDARVLSGEIITLEKLIEEIKKDKDFYTVSGGGVTFSGGEPLLQQPFLLEALKRCKVEGIHTAIETAGNAEWRLIEELLPYLDYILYDIKFIDEEKHRVFTGVSNRKIFENAKKLMTYVPERLLFRMPVIPGCNDTEYDAIVNFVGKNWLELLPYHTIGIGKYEALNREYKLKDIPCPIEEDIRKMADQYENVIYDQSVHT